MNKSLFLGDSITEGFDLQQFFPGQNFVNHGISGYSSGELLDAMKQSWFALSPEKVFICIGTNDLARDVSFEQILENIRKMVNYIRIYSSPECKIYLTSLFPTRHNPPRPNPVIYKFNGALHELAIQCDCDYLHFNIFFTDENRMLKREFTNDGLHLNDQAYKKWVVLIKNLL